MALDLGTLAATLTVNMEPFEQKLRYIPPEVAATGAKAGKQFGEQFTQQAKPKVAQAVATGTTGTAANAGTESGAKFGTAFEKAAAPKVRSTVNEASAGAGSAGAGSRLASTWQGVAAAIAAVGVLAQQVGAQIQAQMDANMPKASAYADMLLSVNKNASTLTDGQTQSWRQIGGMVRDMQGSFLNTGKSFGTWAWDAGAALVGMKGQTATVTDQFTQLDDAVKELGTVKAAPALKGIVEQLTSMNVPASKILDLLPQTTAALRDQAHQLNQSVSDDEYVQWMGGNVPAAVLAAAKAQPELAKQLGIATGAMSSSTDATQKATSALQAYLDKITAVANKQLGLRAARRDYEAAIDDATKTFWKSAGVTDKMIDKHGRLTRAGEKLVHAYRESGKAFDIHTEKGRANQDALDRIADKGLAVVQSLQAAGKSSKTVGAQIASTRADYVKAAEAMGMAHDKAVALANSLKLINDKHVTVTTTYTNVGAGTGGGRKTIGKAVGGKIPGTASSDHDDKVPVLATPDEWMIQRRATRYYGDDIMAAINAARVPRELFTGLATGGRVGGSVPSSGGEPLMSMRGQTTVQVTNYYPRAEPTSVTTNRALELAAALGG